MARNVGCGIGYFGTYRPCDVVTWEETKDIPVDLSRYSHNMHELPGLDFGRIESSQHKTMHLVPMPQPTKENHCIWEARMIKHRMVY